MSADDNSIRPGSLVVLHIGLHLEDGSEALSTFGEDPVTCTMGDGTLQAGLELALYGLGKGDRQTLNLLPQQAYGYRDPALIQHLPLADFDAGPAPESGQLISFALPNGEETPGLVLGVEDGTVEVDFNHPLAGHEISFTAEIIDVTNPRNPIET